VLPPKQATSPAQRELLALFKQLNAQGRESLLDYARFLAQQKGGQSEADSPAPALEPLGLPRPEEETVVAAIRRLSQNYPMLNKDELLHQASALMSAHVLQGRSAKEVIDELEQLFMEAYGNHAGGED
jgi:hypothetical protein